jgi:hypothetical protein
MTDDIVTENFHDKKSRNFTEYLKNQRSLVSPITYTKYFVAYLDILGFKELVRSEKKLDKDKIEIYFALIREGTKKILKRNPEHPISSKIISDSVILSIQCDEKADKLNNFVDLCFAVREIQRDLAINDIWLRGAIAFGDAYIDSINNNIVGKAYIKSYFLGEKLAVHPRIIIDNDIIWELGMSTAQNLIATVNKQYEYTFNEIVMGESILFEWEKLSENNLQISHDVALFIDYLSSIPEDKILLRKVEDNIKKNIYSHMEVYPKYRWVLDYLKICCSRKGVGIKELLGM